MVRRMRVRGAGGLSDHKVKCVEVKEKVRRWRTAGRIERFPKVRWEKLKLPEVQEEYREKMRELRGQGEEMEDERGEWERLSKLMRKSAEAVCGVEERKVQNPWTVGREEEIREMNRQIEGAVNRRNRVRERMGARIRLRPRARREGEASLEQELSEAREEVASGRRELKRRLRMWEREWWEIKMEECREACATGISHSHYPKCFDGSMSLGIASPDLKFTTRNHFVDIFRCLPSIKAAGYHWC